MSRLLPTRLARATFVDSRIKLTQAALKYFGRVVRLELGMANGVMLGGTKKTKNKMAGQTAHYIPIRSSKIVSGTTVS